MASGSNQQQQQQQQQKTWDDVHGVQQQTKDTLRGIQAQLAQTTELGNVTLEELGKQGEILRNIDQELDEIDDKIDYSNKLTNKIGAFFGAFFSVKHEPKVKKNSNNDQTRNERNAPPSVAGKTAWEFQELKSFDWQTVRWSDTNGITILGLSYFGPCPPSFEWKPVISQNDGKRDEEGWTYGTSLESLARSMGNAERSLRRRFRKREWICGPASTQSKTSRGPSNQIGVTTGIKTTNKEDAEHLSRVQQNDDEINSQINAIGNMVDNLGTIARAQGEEVQAQSHIINSIAMKTDNVGDKMVNLNVKVTKAAKKI